MKSYLVALPVLLFLLLTACSGGDVNGARTAWMAFNIEQRHTKELDDLAPGLSVRIDDITNGKTFLTVSVDGETVKGEYIAANQTIKAPVNGRTLYISCTKLDNKLIGRDKAVLQAGWAPAESPVASSIAEIHALLDKIRNSELTFIRNEETYSGPEAAEFLEMKWNSRNAIIRTKAAFIDQIATKSETTDQYYMVVLKDGKQVPLANWLRYLD